jgi:hypothetical protein
MGAALPPIPGHLYRVARDHRALALGSHLGLADPGFLF